MVVLFTTQPTLSTTCNVYVPALKFVTVSPVCELTFELQLYVNGGVPLLTNAVISPSFPLTGCIVNKLQDTELDVPI